MPPCSFCSRNRDFIGHKYFKYGADCRLISAKSEVFVYTSGLRLAGRACWALALDNVQSFEVLPEYLAAIGAHPLIQ
jgi:hypothetical protein